MRARESAQKYQVQNVKNWLDTHVDAIKDKEQRFIEQGTDLISVGNIKAKSPLQLLFEKCGPLKMFFRKKPRPGQVSTSAVQFWSHKKMEGFSDSILILAGLLMLYGPMWWLNWVSDDSKRLGIITGFVAVFAVGLRFASSEARPFEVLGATAA